jgi:hypothetical protein
MAVAITMFKASDNQIFETEKEADIYEAKLQAKRMLISIIEEHTGSIEGFEYENTLDIVKDILNQKSIIIALLKNISELEDK